MKVLFLVSSSPLPPLNGMRIIVDALARELPAQGVDLEVVSLCQPDQTGQAPEHVTLVPEPPADLIRKIGQLPSALLRRQPLKAARIHRLLGDVVARRLEKFDPDAVLVSSGRLAVLAPQLAGVPTVLAALDDHAENIAARQRLANPVKARLLQIEADHWRRAMRDHYARFDLVTAVTAEDAESVARNSGRPVTAVPNGVDTELYAPADIPVEPGLLVMTGNMSYAPNVDAAVYTATEILPLVQREVPDARLALVGRDPDPAVRRLAGERVVVTGTVDSVVPWLQRADVFLNSMRSGSGIKNKFLEALAVGTASVTTALGAQGIDGVDGTHFHVGGDADELARHTVRLLQDQQAAEQMRRKARQLVTEQYSWASVARTYRALLEQARAGRASSAVSS